MVIQAEKKHLPQLKQLWKDCFGDTDAYIDIFYRYHFNTGDILVWIEDGQVVSMLHILRAHIWENGRKQPVCYLYACATEESYRERGIFGTLLEKVKEREEGMVVLVPAEGKTAYYEGQGMTCFLLSKARRLVRNHSGTQQKELCAEDVFLFERPIDFKKYKQIRDDWFCREGYIEWDERAVEAAVSLCEEGGGFICGFLIEGEEHSMMAYVEEKILYIIEITISPLQWKTYGLKIAEYFQCREIRQKEQRMMAFQSHFSVLPYLGLVLD